MSCLRNTRSTRTSEQVTSPERMGSVWLFFCVVAFVVLCPGVDAHAVRPHLDVLYMNHPPMQPTVREIRDVLTKYGEKVSVSWYDADTKEAQTFAAAKGLHEHIPIAIWIDDAQKIKLGPRTVTFVGFPKGSGPGPFQGDWTMQDLKTALDQAISGRR